jgi:hypothetical protein
VATRREQETVKMSGDNDLPDEAALTEDSAIPDIGAVRRTYPIETRIDAEQVRLLLAAF